MKSKVDKLDVYTLVSVPVNLRKLSDDVVERTEYNEMVKKVNAIQTTDIRNLVKKNWL